MSQFSLLNTTGSYGDFSTDHNLSCLGKTFRGQALYPSLASFVLAFPHAVNFRVNLMGPGAELSAHEENLVIRTRNGKVGARLRFHLPVITNPHAELTLDGWVYALSAGTVYLVNHASIHSAVNGAPQLVRRPIVVRDNAVPRRGKRHRAACPAALKVGHLSMAAATAHYMQL